MDSDPFAQTPDLLVHRTWLERLARRLVRDANDADDLAQATWMSALRSPPEPRRPLRGWLATILRNHVRTQWRERSRRTAREHQVAREESVPSSCVELEEQEEAERLWRAVDALPEPYRTTILLRFYEALAPREIAAELGIPVETVRTRTRRALDLLRGAVADPTEEEPDARCAGILPVASFGGAHTARPRLLRPRAWARAAGGLAAGALVALVLGGLAGADPFPENAASGAGATARVSAAEPPAAWGLPALAPAAHRRGERERATPPHESGTAEVPAGAERSGADESTGRIHGRVLVAPGVAAEGGALEVRLDGALVAAARAEQGTGRFLLPGLPAGAELALVARAPGHAPGGAHQVVLRAGGDLDVGALYVGAREDPRSTNRLEVVVRGPDGPVEGATVTATTCFYGAVFAFGALEREPGGTIVSGRADAAGRVVFEQLPAGAYDLCVEADGLAFEVRPGHVVQRETRAVVPIELEPEQRIDGQVVGPDGAPVAGVRVAPLVRWGDFRSYPPATSDGAGRFVLTGLKAGRYFLFALREDGRGAELHSVAAGTSDLRLVVRDAAELEIHATDAATGADLDGVTVRVFREMPFGYLFAPAFDLRAEAGVARKAVPPSTYGLEVSAPGYALAALSTVRVPSEGPIEVALEPAGRIRGRVVCEGTSEPVPGAVVYVERGGYPPSRRRDQQALTGADGSFTLDRLPPGRNTIWVSHPDHTVRRFDDVEALRDPQTGSPREFPLGAGGRVEGRVTGEEGLPLAGETVWVARGIELRSLRTTVVAADGTYAFAHLPAGDGYSVAVGPGFPARSRLRRSEVTVTEGETTRVDLGAAPAGRRVVGVALRDGAPAAGLPILLTSSEGEERARALTEPDGRFEFHGVPPGAYAVRASGRRSRPEPVEVHAEREPREVVLVVTASRIVGRVVEERTGRPVAGAWVDCEQVTPPEGAPERETSVPTGRLGEVTAEDGSFAFDDLAGASYVLRVQHDGHGARVLDPIDLRGGAVHDVHEIALGAACTVVGTVRDGAGAPLEDAVLTLHDDRGRRVFWISLSTTASDGTYAQTGLAAGSYDLVCERAGFAPSTKRIVVSTERPADADFVLGRGARLWVVVVGDGERPVEGATVQLHDAQGALVQSSLAAANFYSRAAHRTDGSGRLLVDGAPVGTFLVRATADDGRTAEETVELAEDGLAVVELLLR